MTELEFINLLRKHTPNAVFEQYDPQDIRDLSTITRDAAGRIKQLEIDGYVYTYTRQYDVVTEVYRGAVSKYRYQYPSAEYNKLTKRDSTFSRRKAAAN